MTITYNPFPEVLMKAYYKNTEDKLRQINSYVIQQAAEIEEFRRAVIQQLKDEMETLKHKTPVLVMIKGGKT